MAYVKIDNNKKAILKHNDNRPARLYVNGELMTDISYIDKTTEQDTYTSEYKANLIGLELQGNTIQDGSPTVETPIPIQNTGDNGIDVELSGVNKLISPSTLKHYWNETNYLNYDVATQTYEINYTSYGISLGICHFDTPIPAGTPYTLLAEVVNDDFELNKTSGQLVLGLYRKDDTGVAWAGKTLDLSGLNTNKVVIQSNITTRPTTDVWLLNNHSAGQYVKNLKVRVMVYFGDKTITKWQPYFNPVTVNIPNEVTLTDGTVVLLRFAKFGDIGDTLTISNGKVEYVQRIAKYVYNEATGVSFYYYRNPSLAKTYLGVEFSNAYPFKTHRAKGFCSHEPTTKVGTASTLENVWVGINNWSDDIYWVGILDVLGFTSHIVDRENTTSEEKSTAIMQFKEWLLAQENNGNPFTVEYEIPTKQQVVYDLTDTEVGQQLLALAEATQNQTNIITATREIPLSKKIITYAKWGGNSED